MYSPCGRAMKNRVSSVKPAPRSELPRQQTAERAWLWRLGSSAERAPCVPSVVRLTGRHFPSSPTRRCGILGGVKKIPPLGASHGSFLHLEIVHAGGRFAGYDFATSDQDELRSKASATRTQGSHRLQQSKPYPQAAGAMVTDAEDDGHGKTPAMKATLSCHLMSLLFLMSRNRRLPHRERIIPREHEVHRLAVGAHPLRRQAAALARADIPRLGVERRGPRPPGFGRIIDAEAALKPHAERMRAVRENLAPEIALQRRIVSDAAAEAVAAIRKHRASFAELKAAVR